MAVDQATITITSAGLSNATYAAGDCLGTVWSASGFAQANNGSGAILGVSLIDENDGLTLGTTIYGFDTTVALTDNAAFAPSDAELKTMVPGLEIQLAPPDDLANNRVAAATGFWPYTCIGAGTTLYFAVVTRGATVAFPSAGLLTLRLAVARVS